MFNSVQLSIINLLKTACRQIIPLLLLLNTILSAQNSQTETGSFTAPVLTDETVVYYQDFHSRFSEWQFSAGWALGVESNNNSALVFNYASGKQSAPFFTAEIANLNLADPRFLNAGLSFKIKSLNFPANSRISVEYSADRIKWLTLRSYDHLDTEWQTETIPLDFACGQSAIALRYFIPADSSRLSEQSDGQILIDDFKITASSVDYTAPLIIHSPRPAFESSPGENEISADVFDLSGLKSVRLFYRVNQSSYEEALLNSTVQNRYTFIIPPQLSGSLVEYRIEAVDNSANHNMTVSADLKYIAGYQPAAVLADIAAPGHNLFYDAASSSGIKRLAIPVKNLRENRQKLLSYLLIRSFPADDPSENQIGIRFLEPLMQNNNRLPGKSLSAAFSFKINEKTTSDPYGYLLIDLRDQKFGLEKFSDSLLYLELSAERNKSALVYLPRLQKTGWECFLNGAISGGKWENAEFTDSTGTVIYPIFQSDLIFSSRDMEKENRELAENLKLENIANPLNNSSSIRFVLAKRSQVFLAVYDLLGREINTLINGQLREGAHQVGLNSGSYASGIYYYILKVDNKIIKRKMVVTP